ncbi:hypothetical protein UUU_27870 [Klebsiella pneumoniae subsp. pneumoniae DSM 30104 = JCM 1662 = NBRC 14940]|nr:hypothetical protein UUU_27870 [Klebsiella pneumoniae subsp. pneumoniae DSM 30104 = JCM 1662 = NBRC 14940]
MPRKQAGNEENCIIWNLYSHYQLKYKIINHGKKQWICY